MKTRSNPELYAQLCQPRPRADVAASLTAFDEELYALRAKHGIADLLYVAGVAIEDPDGSKVEILQGYYGNTGMALPMVGAVFAGLRQQQEEETLAMAAFVVEALRESREGPEAGEVAEPPDATADALAAYFLTDLRREIAAR